MALCATALLSFAASALPETPTPIQDLELAVVGTEITVKGLSVNGEAILTGASHEPLLGAVEVQVWSEQISDDDGDGIATFDIGREVPLRSIWAAVEISSGLSGSTSPQGADFFSNELGQEIVEVDELSGHRIVKLERTNLQYVLVRPGVGAWALEAWDAGTGDLRTSGPDGWLHVDPVTFPPLGDNTRQFTGLDAGDILAIIDPDRLDFQYFRDLPTPQEGR